VSTRLLVVATRIEQDIRTWSAQVLEVPNPHLKGLPACPYARKAWKEDKVLVLETDDVGSLADQYCQSFNDHNKDLIIVATFNIPDIDDFNEYIEEYLNVKYPELHCMGFHPDYGAEEAELDFLLENDWDSEVEENYCMIFIQDLKQVVEASDKLIPLGYYDVYPKDEYEALVTQRKRRYLNGNETP
jgi:hypothetical protein